MKQELYNKLKYERRRSRVSFYYLISDFCDDQRPEHLTQETAYWLLSKGWAQVPESHAEYMLRQYQQFPYNNQLKKFSRIPLTPLLMQSILDEKARTQLGYADIFKKLSHKPPKFTYGRISQWANGNVKWANEECLHLVLEAYWNTPS